jgi:hypothetical protein
MRTPTLSCVFAMRSVGLALASRFTIGAVALTLVLQLLAGGRELLRSMGAVYSHPRMLRALTSMALGIFVFALPSIQPDRYWLYHSLWHVLMGAGYVDLYQGLLDKEAAVAEACKPGKIHATQLVAAKTEGDAPAGRQLRPRRPVAAAVRA